MEKMNWRLEKKNKNDTRTERNKTYLGRAWITIEMDEAARAVDASPRRRSPISFVSELAEDFKNSIIQLFLELAREGGMEHVKSVPETESYQTFCKN